MAFPKSRILSTKYLAQTIKESAKNGQRFCFILGSGASVESGIPSGSTLEMRWMDCLMGKMSDRDMPPMDADETRRLAKDLCDEKEMEHPFEEIEEAWKLAKKASKAMPSKYYFDIYKLRFHAEPRNRYNYLEKIMEGRDPSLGYHTLAKLLTEDNQNNLVITTNFDSLVEDALFLYTDKKPLVISHESLTDYIEVNTQRPIVAKVHRGLMYAPFNSPETTHELKAEWQKALSYAFSTYTPIVIGYAGGDHSLMSFLDDDTTVMRNGVYWCYLGKPDPAELPEKSIQALVEKRKGWFVSIDGFDALMVEIGKIMYEDAIRPGRTEESLKEKHDKRVQRYNEQWDELNKNPEIKETLQTMNEEEQREEKQREEKKALTTWDYIRRGIRANEEGRKQEAIAEYSEAIKADPDCVVAYNNRGIVYSELKEHEKAIEDYTRAIGLDPNDAEVYTNRGVAYRNLKQYERAMEDYAKAIELNPNCVFAYNNRGNIYGDLEQYEKAIEDFTKAIELDSNYADAYNNRGVAYSGLNQYEKAIEDYAKAIELNPNCVFAYNNRGNVYGDLEQYEKAIEDYTKAIKLDPQYKDAYLNRAEAYQTIGKNELAEADQKAAEAL